MDTADGAGAGGSRLYWRHGNGDHHAAERPQRGLRPRRLQLPPKPRRRRLRERRWRRHRDDGCPVGCACQLRSGETLYTGGKQWGPAANWNPVWPTRDRHPGSALRDAVPVRPARRRVHPVARRERRVDRRQRRTSSSCATGVTWQRRRAASPPRTSSSPSSSAMSTALDASATCGPTSSRVEAVDDQTVALHVLRTRRTSSGTNCLYDQPDRARAHLWAEPTEEHRHGRQRERAVGSGAYMYQTHDQTRMVWVNERRLVGHRGPRPRGQAPVHRRPRQHQQRASPSAWCCRATST